jgi:hypothetical protein
MVIGVGEFPPYQGCVHRKCTEDAGVLIKLRLITDYL